MNSGIFESREYKRSRFGYVIQCAVEYMVLLLLSDAFLAKLLLHLGMDDATTGVISSLINFAFLIELVIIPLMGRLSSYKRAVIISDVISFAFSLAVYILPFVPVSRGLCRVLAYIFVAGSPILRYFGRCMYFRWANAYVHPEHRAGFSAVKEIVSLVGGISVSLAAGYMVDSFEAAGNIEGAFRIIAWYIFISAIINLICLLMIKDIEAPGASDNRSFRQIIECLFHNRPFLSLLICESLEFIAIYFTLGFLGTYKTVELGYSVWDIQLITSASYLLRLVVSLPAGRYSDRHSYAHGFLLGLSVMLFSFMLLIFTAPGTRWLMVCHIILYNVSLSAIQQNRANMIYDYVPLDMFTQALALKEGITGIFGFLSSLAAGRLLDRVQLNGCRILGFELYAQQFLALITCIIMAITVVYTAAVILRQPQLRS